MKVLFATKNPAKVKRFEEKLKEKDIELLTINDVDVDIDVDENGSNAIENAIIKAKAYYEATKIPTIGMDDNLFFEDVPENKQPGTHVRRINGKELNDDEMIEYYSNLAKEFGGKITAKWVYGMAICNDKGISEFTWSKNKFDLVDTPHEKRNQGYPLDSISIIPEYNKYRLELTEQEKEEYQKKFNDDGAVQFIINHIN